MTEPKPKPLPITFDPAPGLKDRIDRDAADQGRSINDLIVEILAKKRELPFGSTGRKGSGSRGGSSTLLRLPAELYALIAREHLTGKLGGANRSMQEIVLRDLCDHYSLTYGRS